LKSIKSLKRIAQKYTMDLQQRKLTKSEWESIEVPVSSDEIEVLQLIIRGYDNVNTKYNKTNSLLSFLKMDHSDVLEDYLYNKYFADTIKNLVDKYGATYLSASVNSSVVIKKSDMIRMQKNTMESIKRVVIYENILLEHMTLLVKYKKKKDAQWEFHYFTLHKLMKNTVIHINRHIVQLAGQLLAFLEEEINIARIIEHASDYIEKNTYLLQYCDMMLYEHQKEVFTACKNKDPKLVLYIAPTGTGKTLTPLGLLGNHRVIFVCAARHVGLALARAAISVHKKVAFAFGCSSAEEIRLHYFSAKEFTKNWKSGGIWKVDNTVGDKVEIMICDIKSYLPAMYYMLAFNQKENIITYWDEPTITMDYAEHDMHEIIKKNWSENLIPNMILSSATLPKLHELPNTIADFKEKFPHPSTQIFNIVSHDCRKSIPILNKNGYVVLPHSLSENYDEVKNIVIHCENYLTLLRYFDLSEISKFIAFMQSSTYVPASCKIERYFASLDDVNMTNIKMYYLRLLKNVIPGTWGAVYINMYSLRKKRIATNDSIDAKGNKLRKTASIGPGVTMGKIPSAGDPLSRIQSEQIVFPSNKINEDGSFAVYITTKDSYTLTDGPTIYLANDVEKIAKFCIQQASIPEIVMNNIVETIDYNNKLNERIDKLERDLEDMMPKEVDEGEKKTKKMDRAMEADNVGRIKKELELLYSMIKVAKLNDTFVPNKQAHLKKWAEDLDVKNAFTSMIDEAIIVKIMKLKDVADSWKILLLMGIGVFTNHESIDYTEIMKSLADQQKLYIIIASSDYIYGTNYQFCHGYLSKDMDLTQEKIIQAMGRIGRNKIQQEYTVRFRDDSHIVKLFTADAEKPETINMNRLFS